MKVYDVIRAAIPNAGDEICEHIIWGRTPFPCGVISAKSLYRAASAYRRAAANKIILCEFCHRPAITQSLLCGQCDEALHG